MTQSFMFLCNLNYIYSRIHRLIHASGSDNCLMSFAPGLLFSNTRARQGSANAAQEHAGVDIHSELATADATLSALSTVFASFKYEARESIQPRTPDGYSCHWFGYLTIGLRLLIEIALILCTVLLMSGDRAYARYGSPSTPRLRIATSLRNHALPSVQHLYLST